MFRLPAPLCCKLFCNLTASPTSSKQRTTWDAASWAWSPKNSHWIKQLSISRLWQAFLVDILLMDKGTRADSSSSPGLYRDPEPWFLCPSACSTSPDESGWVSPGSRISHYWLMILSFIQWRKKLPLKLGFKMYLAAQFGHRAGCPQSEDQEASARAGNPQC